jgi:hypothetical protein
MKRKKEKWNQILGIFYRDPPCLIGSSIFDCGAIDKGLEIAV